jgi:integrase/recombinase XerD
VIVNIKLAAMDIVIQERSIVTSDRVKELVTFFLNSLDVKQSSRLLYERTLKQYFTWVNQKGYLLSEVARPQILQYKEELLASGRSSLTVSSYLTVVKSFYAWAEAEKLYPNVARAVKIPARKQQFRKQPLLPAQATALLNYYQQKALRDYAIINLLLRTGLRTIEAVRASIGDVVFKGSQRVLLVQGKGKDEKDNFVILTDKAWQPIAQYLASRGKAALTEPLFTSTSNNSKGGRLSTRAISFLCKEGLKAIGLNESVFTAHSLRHTTAVTILRAGGTLEAAQLTLRHSNPATTQIYTATLNEERRLENNGEALIDTLY